MRRFRRFVLRLLFALATVALLVVVALWAASRSVTVQDFLRARLVAALRDAVGGEITIGAVGGTLGRLIVLEDVRVAADGRPVLHVRRIEATYAVLALLHRRVQLDRVVLDAPRIWLVHADGRFQLPASHGSTESGPGIEIRIARFEVRGARAAIAFVDTTPPRRFALSELTAAGSATVGGERTEVVLESFAGRPRGIALSPLEAAARVTVAPDGTIELPLLHLATARSRVEASGHLTRGTALSARLTLAPLDARDVSAVFPASTLRTNVSLHLDAAGPWSAVVSGVRADLGAGGRAHATATIDLTADPPRYEVMARGTALDPAAAVEGLVAARIDGRVRAAGEGLGKRPRLAWQLRLDPSEIAGTRLDGLRLRGRTDGPVHHARGTVTVPAGGAALRAALRLGDSPAYRAAARLAVNDVATAVPALPGWVHARVRLAGRGFAPATRTATLHAALDGASLRGVALTRGTIDASLAGEALDVRRAEIEGPALRAALSGTGDLGTPRADARLVTDADLGALGAALGHSGRGKLHAEATARGPLHALAVAATVSAETPAYRQASARSAAAKADLTGVGGPAARGTVSLQASELRVGTRAPQALAAAVDWRRQGSTDTARLAVDAHDEAGAVQHVTLTVTRSPAGTRGELLEALLTPPEGPAWRLARPARFQLTDGIRTEPLTMVAGRQQLTLTGSISTAGANDATVALREIALGPLCALTHRPECAGRLAGDIRLTGTATAPRADGHLTATRLRVSTIEYGTLELDTRYAEGRATLHATLRNPRAGEADVDGTIPMDLAWAGPGTDVSALPVDLRVHAAQLDVSIIPALVPETIRHASGAVSVDVTVTGPRSDLKANGDLAFDGTVQLAVAGVRYEDVRLRAAARGRALEVREVHAHSGDGTLTGEGRVGLTAGGDPEIGVTLRLDKFLAVRRQVFEAATSGQVAVRGALTALVVTGDLDVEHAVIRPAALPASGTALERDRTIVLVGAPEPPADAQPPEETPPIADTMSLAVRVRVARNAWIQRADANIEIAGDLRIQKDPFGPVRIFGEIRLVRGWYQFQGRKFELDEGTIIFTGNTPPQPTFDVRASYRTPEYRITVHIEGSTEKPHLTLSSEPPLEQADIFAVILFGKPSGQLGKEQSVEMQRKALQLAGGYVMPELRTSVMNTLGLDALDVELPEGSNQPGKLSVGRYVAGDVFVSLAQEFGSRAAEWVSVEYSLTRSISLRGSSSTRGESAVDLFWHRRY